MTEALELWAHAYAAIRTSGRRVTAARARVFVVLLEAEQALSEPDIERRLSGPALDCVTIYRVLEFLAQAHLVYRVTDDHGVRRFQQVIDGDVPRTLFECTRCGRAQCLSGDVPSVNLPEGFMHDHTLLRVAGLCPSCTTREPTGMSAAAIGLH